MRRLLTGIALLGLTVGAPALASAQAGLDGLWTNPKRTVIVNLQPCGPAWCGKVVAASDKAQIDARKGGTTQLIGTEILSGLRPAGSGRYKGRVFMPKRNMHATATVRTLNSDTLVVTGCLIAGLLCDEQRWSRVGG